LAASRTSGQAAEAGASVAPVPAAAATVSDVYELGTVDVTASGLAGETTGGTTLSTTDFQDRNANTLRDAVDLVPGVSINTIGPRNEGSMSVRGFDLRQVPVFLDGIPVYVPYDGYGDMNRFTTFDLSQVTVEKSTASVLYGPNTLGGAINMVTRRPTATVEGSVGGGIELSHDGDYSGQYEYLNFGTNQGKWYYQASGSIFDHSSFTLPDDFESAPAEKGGKRDNSDAEDWRILQRLGFTPNSTDEYSLTYSRQEAEKGIPPYAGEATGVVPRYWRFDKWDRQSLYLITRTALSDDLTLQNRVFWDEYENSLDSYDDNTYTTQSKKYAFHSHYDDYSYGGSSELAYELGDNTTLKSTVYGKDDVHREHNRHEPVRQYKDRTLSLALEGTQRFLQDWELTVGGRYDRREGLIAEDYNSKTRAITDFPDAFADSWNGQVSLKYNLSTTQALHVTTSRTSRLPTLKDRYSYRLGTAKPNPELTAETADNYELGYRGSPVKGLELETALFYSDIGETIQSVSLTPSLTQMQNVGTSRAMGWEAGAKVSPLESLDLGATYTLLDRENRTDPSIELTDTPRHKLYAYVAWRPLPKLEMRPGVRYETGRYTTSDGKQQTDSFGVFELMARYEITSGATVQVGVQNLTDELYAYQEGYPESGRSYYARFEYSF
jgi:iron complex outermembrane receptor protein